MQQIITGVPTQAILRGINMKRKLLQLPLLLILITSCSGGSAPVDNYINVSVEESDFYSVLSENPIKAKRGDDVKFEIDFVEDCEFKSATNAEYVEGYLISKNVQCSQTIHIEVTQYIYVYIENYENSHYTVTSTNPLKVEKGSDAVFSIEFDDGYVYDSSPYGEYSNGKLVLSNVEDSINFSVISRIKGNLFVEIVNNNDLGESLINGVSTNHDYVNSGETICVEAVPNSDKQFVCWSLNEPITKVMPLSFDRIFEITIKEDTKLYANYWDSDDNTIVYHGNGGETKCGDDLLFYPHVKGNHIRLNTIQGSNVFKRSGFMLESWNTEQDGSGTRIGLGSRVKIVDESIPLHLYAQWIKETDESAFTFVYDESSNSYFVSSCSSNDALIVVPSQHQGLQVSKINENSFISLPFTDLYLPEHLIEVESNSLIDCVNFDAIHFYDYLSIIPDDFYNTNKPSHIYINANTDPCFVGSYQNAFVHKIDLLLECSDEKMVIIGNSNTLYSIDGSILSEYFNTDVISLGVQQGVGIAWELACLRYFCKTEHNIVIFCCEFGNALYDFSFSENKYYAAESNYDLLLAINFNDLKWSGMFSSYTSFKEVKSVSSITPYSKNDYNVDKYGCKKYNIEPYRDDDWAPSTIYINYNLYKNGTFKWVENFCEEFTNSTFLQSSCSFNKNCIPVEKRDEFYTTYQDSMSLYSSFPVISQLSNYAFPGSAFHNDNYHLIYSYAVERTNRLITDLNSYYSLV